MSEFSWVIGFAVKHHLTETAVNDLLNQLGAPYEAYTSIRAALQRQSGLKISSYPCCAAMYNALQLHSEDGSVTPCDMLQCASDPVGVKTFQYFEHWPQLKAWIQDQQIGPMLFDHMKKCIRKVCDHEHPEHTESFDFFCGSNFKKSDG